MPTAVCHLWLTAPHDAVAPFAAGQPGSPLVLDADRRLRGPYTATGALLRELVPELHKHRPDLLRRHAIEILAAAPETLPLVGPAPDTLTSTAADAERTRWYSALRTRRIAHGLVDLLAAWSAIPERSYAVPVLVYRDVDRADATDLEFLELALRRLDPARLRIVAASAQPEPPATLSAAVAAHAVRHTLPADAVPDPADPHAADPDDQVTLARAYVAADCALELPTARAAYQRLDPARRAELHDRRAEELEQRGEFSLRLGAVVYHRERGSAPHTDGLRACAEAVGYCIGMGFYHAGLDLADRMTALVEPDDRITYHRARTQAAQCLALLDRPAETEQLYHDLLSRTTALRPHMSLHYALSLLYTRLYGPEHKDHTRALAYVNTAIAIAEALPDQEDRAFHAVFMNNGKALVQMHLKNLPASLELVTAGIERLDAELRPDQHRLHRSVLHHNRGQVLAALGRAEEALAEFDHVIEVDPHYPEYHFDRGNLYFQLGRHQEALENYEEAVRLSPPFPEVYWNRANVRAELADTDGALADLRYVLDLEPDYTEARVSLASLLLDLAEPGQAAEQAAAGLAQSPDDARLHCTLGLALLELDDADAAVAAFTRALELDPQLHEALVNRAVAAHGQGRPDEALRDLTTAVEQQPDDSDLRYNRGFVLEELHRWDDAVADYTVALEHTDDKAELLFLRGRCQLRRGAHEAARRDLTAHLELGASEHAEEVRSLLGG
ncbi:tetratricopeptide repeat protein [Kitasatospora mediocidica]|uniref:tetratricopeptide repeat protein n=1 Tax=Kitasatospora mediocidica TaxID=58352 RepID=UPI00068C964E|nr:tetratricopeptide repeat protein [Kitasatospora mediocidica]